MKKILLLGVLFAAFVSFGSELLPVQTGPQAFPSGWPGAIYSDATRAMYRESKANLAQYQVLGKVEAQSYMDNILLLINIGDTSLATLKAKALEKYPEADDIVNMEIDAHTFNVLIFFTKTTITMRGVAVKYKK
jgi:hypothetical protein